MDLGTRRTRKLCRVPDPRHSAKSRTYTLTQGSLTQHTHATHTATPLRTPPCEAGGPARRRRRRRRCRAQPPPPATPDLLCGRRAVRAPRSRPRRPPSTAPGLPPRPRRPRRSCWAGPATPELPGGCRAAGHAELPAGPRAPGHDAAAAGLAPRRRPRRSCWPGLAPPASLHCAAAAPPRRGVAGSHQPRHPSISNTRSKAQTCRSVTKHCILQCFAIFIFIDFDSCFCAKHDCPYSILFLC